MKIKIGSVFVKDQSKALALYSDVLGFVKKQDIDLGEFRWLTVVAPEGSDEIELLLEPNENPAAATFQKSIFEQGIPATAFFTSDLEQEYQRLKSKGVSFRLKPTKMEGGPFLATFDDTCGNLIQLVEE